MSFNCGTNVWGNIYRENREKSRAKLESRTILEKVTDHILYQHSIFLRTRLTKHRGKSVQNYLGQKTSISINQASNHQVAVRLTPPGPWGPRMTWTRGWTGAGWWTICSGRRSGRRLKDTEMENNGI